jgi:hypothetical protein
MVNRAFAWSNGPLRRGYRRQTSQLGRLVEWCRRV